MDITYSYAHTLPPGHTLPPLHIPHHRPEIPTPWYWYLVVFSRDLFKLVHLKPYLSPQYWHLVVATKAWRILLECFLVLAVFCVAIHCRRMGVEYIFSIRIAIPYTLPCHTQNSPSNLFSTRQHSRQYFSFSWSFSWEETNEGKIPGILDPINKMSSDPCYLWEQSRN